MSSRSTNMMILVLFLLTVPAGVYFYFTSPAMGYPPATAATIAGVLALAGLALIPIVLKSKSAQSEKGALDPKTGWAILIGFLVLIGIVVAYFATRDS